MELIQYKSSWLQNQGIFLRAKKKKKRLRLCGENVFVFNLESQKGLIHTGMKSILTVSVLKNVKREILFADKHIFMVTIPQISGWGMEIIPRLDLRLKIHVCPRWDGQSSLDQQG